MSAQNVLTQVERDLKEKERQTKLHKRMSAQIYHHLKIKFYESLAKLKPDVNFCPDNDVPYLITAIQTSNDWAFDELLRLGADPSKPDPNGVSPLLYAALMGYEKAVRDLINKKVDPNSFAFNNALGRTITNIKGRALIDNSDWNEQDPAKFGNDVTLSKRLQDWFHQRGEFTEEVSGTAIPFPKTKNPIKAYYTGNTEIIGLLLNAGTKLWMPNSNGFSPLMIVQEPEKCPNYFVGSKNEKIASKVENGLIFFKTKLQNRNGTDFIDITGVYDLQIIRKQFLEYMKANPNKAYNEEDLKSLAQAIQNKVQDEVSEKHEKLAKQLEDTRIIQEEIKENHEQMRLESKQNAAFLNNLIRKDNEGKNWKTRQDVIDKNSITKSFRTAFNTRLRGAISGSVDIAGNNVQRNEKTVKDRASKLLGFLAEHIPVFGAAVGALAVGLHCYSEWSEEKKHKQIARFFDNTAEQEDLSQKLAVELAEYCQFLHDKKVIKNDKAASAFGEKLAAAAYLVILTVEDKACVRGLMFDAVVKSGIMNTAIKEYHDNLRALAKAETSNLLTTVSSIQITGAKNNVVTIYYFTNYLQLPVYQQSMQPPTLDSRVALITSSYSNGSNHDSQQTGNVYQMYAYQQQLVNTTTYPVPASIGNTKPLIPDNKNMEKDSKEKKFSLFGRNQ